MKRIIINYVNNLDINIVNSYLMDNGIYLNKNELIFVFNYLKTNINDLLDNLNNIDFTIFNNELSSDNLNKLKKLYNDSLIKYARYL